MKRSSGNGKWWLLFLVVCGVALWWRLHNRGGDDTPAPAPQTPKPPEPKPEPTRPDAMVVEEPLQPPEPRPLYTSDYTLAGLSTDGKRALLVEGTNDVKSLRVVAIETGKVEADIAMTAYGSDGDPAAIAEEMVRARAVLRGFPLGAAGRLAATPDGTAGAYENGDFIIPMRGDKAGAQLNVPAAYGPTFLDDKTMLVRAYHGRVKLRPDKVSGSVDAEGVYALGWATLDSPVVHEVDGTTDYDGAWVLSESGDALRILAQQTPDYTSCVLEIALKRPFHVTRKRCLDTIESWFPHLSPHGTWVAWQTRANDEAPMRLRTMNIATGEIGIDLTAANTGDLDIVTRGFLTVTDGGRVIAEDIDGNTRVVDPVSKEITTVTLPHVGNCIPRGDHELVCEDHGSVSVATI